jgi:tetratricopeptide (TPR) repeat protein
MTLPAVRTNRKRVLGPIVGLLLSASAALARAEEDTPAPEAAPGDADRGRELARAGLAAYDRGDFREAAEMLEQAGRLFPSAQVLRIQGYALMGLERWDEAVVALEAALAEERRPLYAADREDAERRLANARAQRDAERWRKARAAEAARRPPPDEAPAGAGGLATLGLALGGTGLALGVVAVLVGARGLALASESEAALADNAVVFGPGCERSREACLVDRARIGEDRATAGDLKGAGVGIGIGAAALVAAGVVLMVAAPRGREARASALACSAEPLGIGCRF